MLNCIVATSIFMFAPLNGTSSAESWPAPAGRAIDIAAFCGNFIPHRSNSLRPIRCSSDLRFRPSPKFRHHAIRDKLSMWLNAPKESMTASDDIEIRTFYPRVDRIVAIGDVHGDASALRSCLSTAGLLTNSGEWTGGNTHLVQVAVTVISQIRMLHSHHASRL